MEDDNSSSYTGSYDATLEYGSGSVLVCISEDAMSRYMTLNNDNQGTIDEMQSSGEIGFTAKGTKCNIVKRKVKSNYWMAYMKEIQYGLSRNQLMRNKFLKDCLKYSSPFLL